MEVNKIYQGNCLEVIKSFEDNSIDCCVTSPPYWGLRDYGTGTWEGGDCNCNHTANMRFSESTGLRQYDGHSELSNIENEKKATPFKKVCGKCGAVRIDEQLGLEETPEEYVENMVQLFREVKRILKPTGTLWLNLGDSYMGGGRDSGKSLENASSLNGNAYKNGMRCGPPTKKIEGYKSKDLVGIPWMVAFALRKDGWYLRQDIIWQKPNPMPESVTDRCTKSHEYIFLLSKSPKYYYDNESIKEPTITQDISVRNRNITKLNNTPGRTSMGGLTTNNYEIKNKRSVWNVTLKGFKEAHFATYPEELIEPMIKAGCPEKVCSKCGKPLEIKIIKEPIPEDCKTYLEGEIGDMVQSGSMIGCVTNNKYNEFIKTRKIEKQEIKCDCNEPFAKGIVLDPFMGAGTTAVVAKKLKRNWIGIELNPEYIKIAEKRIKNTIFTNPIF